METLIADSGSTKTDWCTVSDGKVTGHYCTQGINPFQQSEAYINNVLDNELKSQLVEEKDIEQIFFYGAGCRKEMLPIMTGVLKKTFGKAETIEVNSDLLAAARALYGHDAGVACILGTGSNSCFYDGHAITANTPSLGYILGDEGSGAVLGRNLINALFKGLLPVSLVDDFTIETGLTMADVIQRVYREPLPNRFLASLSLFVSHHIDAYEELRALVIENFRAFFKRNIQTYEKATEGRQGIQTVRAIGSIAHYYRHELEAAAALEGFMVDAVMRSPMDGLIAFHH